MPDFEFEWVERTELSHGNPFSQNPFYNEGKAPTCSHPRELEQVRKRHREEMEEKDENPDSADYEGGNKRKRSARSALEGVRVIDRAGTNEVHEDPDSGLESPILGPQQDPKRMSNAMRNFLKVPMREDDEEVVNDTTEVNIPPEKKKLDLAQHARENPIGEAWPNNAHKMKVEYLLIAKFSPLHDFRNTWKKSVPHRSGSTTRETSPVAELFYPSRRSSQQAKPLRFFAGKTTIADMIAALEEIAEEIPAFGEEYGSHVSESPQSEDDPQGTWIRGRWRSFNSLMC